MVRQPPTNPSPSPSALVELRRVIRAQVSAATAPAPTSTNPALENLLFALTVRHALTPPPPTSPIATPPLIAAFDAFSAYLPAGPLLLPRAALSAVLSGPLREPVHTGLSPSHLGAHTPSSDHPHIFFCDSILLPHVRRFVAMLAFYLHAGMLPWNIARLLEATAIAAGIPDPAPGQAGGVRRLVSKHANALLWLGMSLLRRTLDDTRTNWAVALTTRHCPQLGAAATEVLISVANGPRIQDVALVHLITVRRTDGAADAVVAMLDAVCSNWKSRLLGIRSTLDSDDTAGRAIENIIFDRLRRTPGIGSDLKLVRVAEMKDGDRPIFPWTMAKLSKRRFGLYIEENRERLTKNGALSESQVNALEGLRVRLSKQDRRNQAEFNADGFDAKKVAIEVAESLGDGASEDAVQEVLKGQQRVAAERKALAKAWVGIGEELATVARGLTTLWGLQSGLPRVRAAAVDTGESRKSGLETVDVNVERVMWMQAVLEMREMGFCSRDRQFYHCRAVADEPSKWGKTPKIVGECIRGKNYLETWLGWLQKEGLMTGRRPNQN